jgi:gamma-glutamylcyclotransferase (GGCT)/AIG2-like uncharacterized protein YtfP
MSGVYLFVYGSLKRAGRHHDELENARFLGEVETVPGYALEPLGEYLALVARPGDRGRVKGELFELSETDPSLLAALDEFEGDAYVREEVALSHVKYGFALAYLKKAR